MRPIAFALLFFTTLTLAHAANTAMRYLSIADLPYVQAALSDARVLEKLHGLVSHRRYVLTGIERLARPDATNLPPEDRAVIELHLHDPESASTDPDAQIDVVAEMLCKRSGREYEVTAVSVRRHRTD